jgi:hypothetical protein
VAEAGVGDDGETVKFSLALDDGPYSGIHKY